MFKNNFFNREILYIILLYALLFTPNLFVLFYFQEISGSFKMQLGYLLLSIIIWIVPVVFLPKKIFFGIAFFFLLFSPLEIIFVKSLGIPITEGFIEAVYRTNYTEATEQISSNFAFLVLFICSIIAYIFLFLKISNSFLPRNLRLAITALFLLFNGALFVNMFLIQSGEQNDTSRKLKIAFSTTLLKYHKVYPADIVLNSLSTMRTLKKASALSQQIEAFYFEAEATNDASMEEIYILVIGETARYANFHVNGYDKQTTPNLDTISNLLSYSNVYTGANLTSNSVPILITRASPQDRSIQNKEKTILDAFKEAGFYTAWFANQSSEYPIINRLQNEADLFKSNQFGVNVRGFYDESILPEFESVLENDKNKKFIVIHSLGSHFRYTNRYPKEFKKFTPAMKESGYNDFNYQHKERIINSYDNTIYYTDYFLSQLIDRLKSTNKNAVLLYVSDHGENLFDDDKKFIGHGTTNPTKYEYHIPYFIWHSDKYKENNSEKIEHLKNNLNVEASATATFYTLLDMANITYKDFEKGKKQSLSSDKYQVPKERFMINSANEIIKIE